MTSIISMLAATDFSVDGNNAVRRAALLAHEPGARQRILHVLNTAGAKPLGTWRSPTLNIDLRADQASGLLPRETGLHVFHAIECRREAVPRYADVPGHIVQQTRLLEEGATSARKPEADPIITGIRDGVFREGQVTPTSRTGHHGQQRVLDPRARPGRLR